MNMNGTSNTQDVNQTSFSFSQPKVASTPFTVGFGTNNISNPLVPPTSTPFVFKTQPVQNPFQSNTNNSSVPQFGTFNAATSIPLSTPSTTTQTTSKSQYGKDTAHTQQSSNQHPLIILESLQLAYDTSSPHCRFRHVFYNKVVDSGSITQSSVAKPQYIDESLWQQAWSDSPGPDMVPVVASSFDDLDARAELQNERSLHYQSKCKELSSRMDELVRKQSMESLIKLKATVQSFHSLSLQLIRLVKYIEIIRKHGQWFSKTEQQFTGDMTRQRQFVSNMMPKYHQIKEKVALLMRSSSFISSLMSPTESYESIKDIPVLELLEEQQKELNCLVEQCNQLDAKVNMIGS